MEKKEEGKKPEAKKDPAPKKDSQEKVYVFKGNGRHNGDEFKKGEVAKASASQMKLWITNGVVIEQ